MFKATKSDVVGFFASKTRITRHIKNYHKHHIEYQNTKWSPSYPYDFDITECIKWATGLKREVTQDEYTRVDAIISLLQNIKETLMCPNITINDNTEKLLTSLVTQIATVCKENEACIKFFNSFMEMIFICSHCGRSDSMRCVIKCSKCPRLYCHECWTDAFINEHTHKCKICSGN